MSRLAEKISSFDYEVGHSILRDAVYSLKNDDTIIIKEVNKGSIVVVWDRKRQKTNSMMKMFTRNLQETKSQLDDENVYKELPGDVEDQNIKTVL